MGATPEAVRIRRDSDNDQNPGGGDTDNSQYPTGGQTVGTKAEDLPETAPKTGDLPDVAWAMLILAGGISPWRRFASETNEPLDQREGKSGMKG